MHAVYVLQHSVTKQIYIGQTNNLKRRIEGHNSGKQTSTIRKGGKWILIYAEAYREKKDAMEREIRLKYHGRAKQELLKRISNSKID